MAVLSIRIRDLRCKVRLGCDDQERRHPQMVVFNLECQLKSLSSCRSDKISDTASYIAISDTISQICEAGEWRLVEKLAWDLASGLLERFPEFAGIRISVKKNVLESASGAEIEVQLAQEDLN